MPCELNPPKAPRWYDSSGRAVCDVEVSGYGDDIYIESATYDDTDAQPVPDTELDWMQDTFAAELAELAFENAIGAAESYWEGER
jgi:hypothetical protein